MNFGHRNELRAFERRQTEQDAKKIDVIILIVCLVSFIVLRLTGVL